jgi:LAO/AO transport system kinase
LQGIKKGVLEIADMIAITKADGDNVKRAQSTAADYQHAMRIIAPASPTWIAPVVCVSALESRGLDDVWTKIETHHKASAASGQWAAKRRAQQIKWMWAMVDDRLVARLKTDPKVKKLIPQLEIEVGEGRLPPGLAVERIFKAFGV